MGAMAGVWPMLTTAMALFFRLVGNRRARRLAAAVAFRMNVQRAGEHDRRKIRGQRKSGDVTML